MSDHRRRVAASLILAALLAACSSSTSTPDELHTAIDDYRQVKGGVTAAQIDALFARLDAESAA